MTLRTAERSSGVDDEAKASMADDRDLPRPKREQQPLMSEHCVVLAVAAVIAAPVGILLLQPVATTSTGWAWVAALVDHFWRDAPQGGFAG